MSNLNDIKVSVIIPCYNSSEYIDRSLSSALNQTHQNLEIICIDNNSTDNTLQLLNRAKNEHSRIKVLEERRPGANYARNTGLDVATGEWIQFLDSDDWIDPRKIEHQLKLVESSGGSENIGFVAGNEYWIRFSGEKIAFHKFSMDVWKDLILGTLGDTCSNLWFSKSLKEIGGWNTKLKSSQELSLMFEVLKMNKSVIYDPEILTHIYEQEENSISKSKPLDNINRAILKRIEIVRYIKENHKLDYGPVVDKFIYNCLVHANQIEKMGHVALIKELVEQDYSINEIENEKFVSKLVRKIFGLKTSIKFHSLKNKLR